MHLGDITQISGYTAPIVDCIIGGSPCQDLSVAGKRAGLAGSHSGLFMEQIRIIAEMREQSERTTGVSRPRFAVWENVPGALSSNKGEDFRIVLEKFCKIAEKNAVIPRPPKGKWGGVGCIVGDGWSVAWRILDAQFWGVPQRRRRIALIADFGGYTAPEILFERESVRGNIETGGAAWKGASLDTDTGTYPAVARGLTARHDGSPCIDRGPNVIVQSIAVDCRNPTLRNELSGTLQAKAVAMHQNASGELRASDVMPALTTNSNASGRNAPVVCIQGNCIDRPDPSKNQGGIAILDARRNGNGEVCPTLTGDHQNRVTDYTANTYQKTTGPLMANSHPGSYTGQDAYNDMLIAHTLTANSNCKQCEDRETYPIQYGSVRRLTPLECERLQGYPDGWTDIGDWTDSKGKKRKTSDSARYKALGNSIALPPWKWVLKRLCAQYERDATMASLFDGIGGFPLIWEQINGKGSCLWASEIEEFPMAVTKARFI